MHFFRRLRRRAANRRHFCRPRLEPLEQRRLLAAGMIELGPSDNVALDQPRVAIELLADADPGPSQQWESVGPLAFNTFLLDTGANSVLAMATAVNDMDPNLYATQGKFVEQGVAGDHPMDISIPYRFDFAGTSGIRQTLDNTRILSDPNNDFSQFGPWGLVGMPAMVNRVTSLDMTGWAGGGLGLDSLYMKVDFADDLPAEPTLPGTSHRYAVPVDNRLAFNPLDQVVSGDPPAWGDVPFLTAIPTHNGVGQAGNFLFDTGAQISIISSRLALDIGLDSNGDGQLNEQDASFVTTETVGGVGGQVSVPVFAIDEVHLPATRVASGGDVELVWTDLQWLVLDIPTPEGQPSLDGVFGSDLITSGWYQAFFAPGAPDGYIDRLHFDFRDLDQGAGTLYFDLNASVDQVVVPGPGVRIRQTARSTDVTEGAATDTYTIVLQSVPAAPVQITITADAQTQLSTDGTTFQTTRTLTFTDTTPQTITVRAVDDDIAEGPHTSIITHAVTSADAAYNRLPVPDITVNVTDNDLRLLTITDDAAGTHPVTTIDIAEGGPAASYWVALATPPASDIWVIIEDLANPIQATPRNPYNTLGDPSFDNILVFSPSNWNQPQLVELTAVDDALAEGPHQTQLTHSLFDLTNFAVLGQDLLTVRITDNDLGGVKVSPTGGGTNLAEAGATDTYQLALTTPPAGAVQVTVTADAQTQVSADGGATFAATLTLTFTGTAPQTVTVRAVDDAWDEGPHTGTITHAVTGPIADPKYPATLAIPSVTATIADNDTAGLALTETGGGTTVTEGGTADTYTVALTSQPTGDVTVFLKHTAGQITAVDKAQPAHAFLTFTPTNWNTPQEVCVTAVDDTLVEGPHTAVITHAAFSTDPNYQGSVLLTVNVIDNDAGGDGDGDGVPSDVEAGAPHNGDGNADGIPDAQQANVTSLPNGVDASYITLAVPAGQSLVDVRAIANPSPADAPAGSTFPIGCFAYSVTNVGAGQATIVNVYWGSGATLNCYLKYGPTADTPTPHWYSFPYDGTTGARIYADHLELRLVDGLRGDDDLTTNGTIVDPGAPAARLHPWQNPVQPENVNNDTLVSALDVLQIIQEINTHGMRDLPSMPAPGTTLPPFWDVSGDDRLSPLDVLLVISYLNRRPNTPPTGAAGEAATIAMLSAGEGVAVTPAPASAWSARSGDPLTTSPPAPIRWLQTPLDPARVDQLLSLAPAREPTIPWLASQRWSLLRPKLAVAAAPEQDLWAASLADDTGKEVLRLQGPDRACDDRGS